MEVLLLQQENNYKTQKKIIINEFTEDFKLIRPLQLHTAHKGFPIL